MFEQGPAGGKLNEGLRDLGGGRQQDRLDESGIGQDRTGGPHAKGDNGEQGGKFKRAHASLSFISIIY